MNYNIKTTELKSESTIVNAMAFIPHTLDSEETKLAIFTHGYTSHKGSILNWATRMAEEGVPAIIFDQPGHFLGSFHDVQDFETFKKDAPALFMSAYNYLKSTLKVEVSEIVIGGHSLGALTSLIALETLEFEVKTTCICVGFGLPPQGVTHIFNTPFYKSTLHLRAQLVSPQLPPDEVFPWIKKRKEELDLTMQRIHFITGEDDVVVGKDGSQRLAKQLSDLGNDVTIEAPKRLAHHQPELAGPYIKKFLKSQSFLK